MKKIYILFLAFLLNLQANATHMMGGQITAKQISGNNYEFTLTIYRDALGAFMYEFQTLYYYNTNNPTQIDSVNYQFFNGINYMSNNVEEYIFNEFVTLPSPGSYVVFWKGCCRNDAILNMGQGINIGQTIGMRLQTEFTYFANANNSTPVFLNQPITLTQVNNLMVYDPLSYDADGDSLTYDLDIPLDSNGAVVPSYVAPSAVASVPYSVNSTNGVVSWVPDNLGNYQSSILIKEYRAGVLIGTMRRDMQVIVNADGTNNEPFTDSTEFVYNNNGDVQFNVIGGNTITFAYNIFDADSDFCEVVATGEPLLLGANFGITTGSSTMYNNTFSWATTPSMIRSKLYRTNFRTTENRPAGHSYQYDKTVYINVNSNSQTSIKDLNKIKVLKLYPNPAKSEFTINLFSENTGSVNTQIIDAVGQIVSSKTNTVAVGSNIILNNISKLSKGIYQVKNTFQNNVTYTKLVVE